MERSQIARYQSLLLFIFELFQILIDYRFCGMKGFYTGDLKDLLEQAKVEVAHEVRLGSGEGRLPHFVLRINIGEKDLHILRDALDAHELNFLRGALVRKCVELSRTRHVFVHENFVQKELHVVRVSQERSELLDVLVVDVSNGCLGDWSWGIDVLFVHLGAIQRLPAVKDIIDRAQIVIRGVYVL